MRSLIPPLYPPIRYVASTTRQQLAEISMKTVSVKLNTAANNTTVSPIRTYLSLKVWFHDLRNVFIHSLAKNKIKCPLKV